MQLNERRSFGQSPAGSNSNRIFAAPFTSLKHPPRGAERARRRKGKASSRRSPRYSVNLSICSTHRIRRVSRYYAKTSTVSRYSVQNPHQFPDIPIKTSSISRYPVKNLLRPSIFRSKPHTCFARCAVNLCRGGGAMGRHPALGEPPGSFPRRLSEGKGSLEGRR